MATRKKVPVAALVMSLMAVLGLAMGAALAPQPLRATQTCGNKLCFTSDNKCDYAAGVNWTCVYTLPGHCQSVQC